MEDNELIDLTEILDRIFKSVKKLWKLCALIIVVCVTLIETKTFISYHPTYTSSMTVIVSKKDNDILVYSDESGEMNQAFQRALMSSSMQTIIKNDLNISYVPASLNVTIVPDTNFLLVSATSSNPEDAFNVIKSIEANYGQLTKLMNDANMILIDEAKLPVTPNMAPQYTTQAIKGVVVGILISIMIIGLYTLSRRTISKEEHIKNKLHLKCLGNIPEITVKKRSYRFKEQLLVTNTRIPASFKESFRSLLIAIQRKKDSKVFMFTSTLPNEGKSTVSANVALMLAKENKKVALIDLDLRNPSLLRIINLEHTKEQIGDYLQENCSLEDITCKGDLHPNLDLILGIKSYDNSIEMLSSESFKTLMEDLKKNYDYIIVDVPPLLIMQDAILVAKYCDETILVIKQDYAKIYEVMDALDELYEIDGHIMGCVMNSVQKSMFDEDAKGYGYGYGYGKS